MVVLPLRLILKILIGVVGALLIIGALLQGLIYKMEIDKQHLLEDKAAIEGNLAALEIEKKIPQIDMGLESQVREVKKVVKEKARINSLISSQKKHESIKIHGYFETLVNLDLPGIWLTSVEIFSRGLGLKIGGVTLEAESLPKYIKGLQNSQTFKGLSFELVDMQQMTLEGEGIAFRLSSSHGLEGNDESEIQLFSPGT